MKILQLISSGGHYGAESMLLNLCRGLRNAGEEITVGVFLNKHRPNLELAKRLSEQALHCELIPCAGRFDWQAVRSLRKIIRGGGFGIVHSHGYKADFYALAAARLEKSLLVATCHGWPGKSFSLKAYAALDRVCLRYVSRVAAVSEQRATDLNKAGVRREKIVKILNGINPMAFSKAVPAEGIRTNRPDEFVIGMVGRLANEKGCDVLLRSISEIRGEFPGARVVFVGEGPLRDSLKQLAQSLGMENSVHFAGYREDMPSIYAGFDVFVLASSYEGLPMVILEAMASGKPVIATRVGEIPRVIESENTGVLIEPNKTEALRDALLRLLRDSNLREEMGKRAASHVIRYFSIDQMSRAYLDVYRDVVRESGTANSREATAETR